MRDVVMELRLKGVNDYESFEWQKQIRLTWNASEPACKVECGGWSSYQGKLEIYLRSMLVFVRLDCSRSV
jgi:hypothetical protein